MLKGSQITEQCMNHHPPMARMVPESELRPAKPFLSQSLACYGMPGTNPCMLVFRQETTTGDNLNNRERGLPLFFPGPSDLIWTFPR